MLALASGLAFLATVFGALQHRATVLHGYCTEHGELIHVGSHLLGEEASTQSTVVPSRLVQGSHHCAVLSFLSQSSLPSPEGSGIRTALLDATASFDALEHSHQAIPLLRQSPRLPPPRR